MFRSIQNLLRMGRWQVLALLFPGLFTHYIAKAKNKAVESRFTIRNKIVLKAQVQDRALPGLSLLLKQ